MANRLLNFRVSVGLFLWTYGPGGFAEHPIYVGGLTIGVIHLLTGHFFHRLFSPARASVEYAGSLLGSCRCRPRTP